MWPDCATDPEGPALLRAAAEHPDEDTPRLALADWLQEHGEEEVAGALRTSLQERGWVDFPGGVRDRWKPWNACRNGWPGAWCVPLAELAAVPAPAWLAAVKVDSTRATGRELRKLARLTRLQSLTLDSTNVSDAGPSRLAEGTSCRLPLTGQRPVPQENP
jgi:uncharacterized protein (TIGR02996 family)